MATIKYYILYDAGCVNCIGINASEPEDGYVSFEEIVHSPRCSWQTYTYYSGSERCLISEVYGRLLRVLYNEK